MRQCGDFSDRVDLSDHIRAVGKTHQPDPFVKQLAQAVYVKHPSFGVNAPLTHLDPLIRQPTPRPTVGFVILIGDDNGIPRGQPFAKCLRQHIGILRRRRAK